MWSETNAWKLDSQATKEMRELLGLGPVYDFLATDGITAITSEPIAAALFGDVYF